MADINDPVQRKAMTRRDLVHGYNDEEGSVRQALRSQKMEYSRLSWQAQRAADMGLISQDELTSARNTNDSNALQRLLLLDADENKNSGSALETIGDVLSLPNYLMASISEATLKSGYEIDLPESDYLPDSLKFGFSPEAFGKAWSNKTTYSKMAENYDMFGSGGANLVGGFAMDVLLDPTTYLTFGAKAGLKVGVGVTKGSKIATKAAEVGATDLTLTRFGTSIYKRAAAKLSPVLRKEMIERGEKVGANLLSAPLAKEWQDRIAKYAIDEFDTLRKEHIDELTKGWWSKTKSAVNPAGEANQARIISAADRVAKIMGSKKDRLAGMTMEDMFQETATLLGKERLAYDLTKTQTFLAKNSIFKTVFDKFDSGWNVPEEILERGRLAKIAEEAAYHEKLNVYQSKLGKLSTDELDTVSRLVEARGQLLDYGKSGLPAYGPFAQHIEEAAEFVRTEMDEILKIEKEANIDINTVEGYISHIVNPKVREYYLSAMRKNGEENIKAASRWQQQRMIANIAEGEELFGEGAMVTNAMEILAKRKRASLQVLQQHTLYEDIIKNHSLPAAIIHEASRGISKPTLRGWARRAGHSVTEILNVDQVYTATYGNLSKLGFKWDPEDVAASYNRNRELLRYLMRPSDDVVRPNGLSGKFSTEVEALGLDIPEEAKLHYIEYGDSLIREARPLPQKFTFSVPDVSGADVRQGIVQVGKKRSFKRGPEWDVMEAFNMLDDENHPAWDRLIQRSVGGEKVNYSNILSMLRGLNGYTSRWLDSSLTGMIPDLEERIVRVMKKKGFDIEEKVVTPVKEASVLDFVKFAETSRKPGPVRASISKVQKFQEDLASTLASFNQPLEITKVIPQVPETLVNLARATRRAAGILTDDTPITAPVQRQMRDLYVKTGFTVPQIKELSRVLFDKDAPEFVGEADLIIETLRPFATKNPKGSVEALKELPGRLGEKVVPLTITLTRRVTGNIFPEYDDAGEIAARAGRVGGEAGQTLEDGANIIDNLDGTSSRQVEGVSSEVKHAFDEAKNVAEAKQKRVEFIQQKLDSLASPAQRQELRDLRLELTNLSIERKKLLEVYKAAEGDAKKAARKSMKPVNSKLKEVRSKIKGFPEADIKELEKNWKLARREALESKKTLKEAKSTYDSALAASGKNTAGGGGVSKNAPNWSSGTTSDQIRQLRQRLAQYNADIEAGKPNKTDPLAVQAKIDELVKKLASGDMGTPTPRPQRAIKPVEYELYVPEGIAQYLSDLNAPSVPPGTSETARKMIKAWDSLMGYYKTNLLLPFGAYHARNFMQAAATNVLRYGLGFLQPERGKAVTSGIIYALSKYTDLPTNLGPIPMGTISAGIEELGKQTIKCRNGMEYTIKEVIEEAKHRGIFHGAAMSELSGEASLWGRAASALSGAAAGAAGGALVGAVGDQLAGNQDGTGMNYGSILGGISLGLLGGRNLSRIHPSKANKWMGGIPHITKGADSVTTLIQSRWHPFMRAGEAATELPFRMSMFMQSLMEHGSLSDAAKEVYQHMNDYHGLSVVERRYLRRIVPFYAWTKHAVKSTMLQVLERPGAIGNQLKTARSWEEAYDGDPEDIPDYLHNKLVFLTKEFGPDGKYRADRYFVPGITAVEDAAALASGFNFLPAFTNSSTFTDEMRELVQNVGSRVAFPVASAYEASTGTDLYTGRKIEDANADQWDTAPDWLKSVVGYQPPQKGLTRARVNPTMAWVLGEIPVSRFVTFMKKITSVRPEEKGKLDTYSLAQQFLGASSIRVDRQQNTYFINKGRIQRLKALLDNVIVRNLGEPPTSERSPQRRYLRRPKR